MAVSAHAHLKVGKMAQNAAKLAKNSGSVQNRIQNLINDYVGVSTAMVWLPDNSWTSKHWGRR